MHYFYTDTRRVPNAMIDFRHVASQSPKEIHLEMKNLTGQAAFLCIRQHHSRAKSS